MSAVELLHVQHTGDEAMQLRIGFAILALAAAPRLANAECKVYQDAVIGYFTSQFEYSDGLHLPFVAYGTATPVGAFTARGELIINNGSVTGTNRLSDRNGNSIRCTIVAGKLSRTYCSLANIALSAEFEGGTGIYRGVTGGFDGRGIRAGRLFVGRCVGEISYGGESRNGS